jgi:hypothetical protein
MPPQRLWAATHGKETIDIAGRRVRLMADRASKEAALTTDVRELERQAEARAYFLETFLIFALTGPIGIGVVLLLLSGLI